MSNPDRSPLTRLVLVILGLALAGSVCAGFLSVVVGQHQMNDKPAPENTIADCRDDCQLRSLVCKSKRDPSFNPSTSDHCDTDYNDCVQHCLGPPRPHSFAQF